MPTSRRSNAKANRKKKKTKGQLHEDVSIVGPEYFQLLQGEFFGKRVALIVCGEAHYDSLDVTRSGGRFSAREGWVESSMTQRQDTAGSWACRVLMASKKVLPLAKSREWAKEWVEREDVYGDRIVLAWIETDSGRKGARGKSFLLELMLEEDFREELEDPNDEEEEPTIKMEHWLFSDSSEEQKTEYPIEIQDWILQQPQKEGSRPLKLFEWGDLDPEAFAINKRRLMDQDVTTKELDDLVHKRKEDRKRQNIWTFDDWFSHVRANSTDVQLVLEASVPPWEVEVHRPPNTPEWLELATLPTAADCIRCVSEDSEATSTDEHDASCDGMGSYIDYVYRRFMTEMVQEQQPTNNIQSTWLHCIDARDLGSQEANHAEVVKPKWKDLLTEEEWKSATAEAPDNAPDMNTADTLPFRTQSSQDSEHHFFEEKKQAGELKPASEDHGQCHDDSNLDFSFPSFESFFGQNTDILYYSPHVRVSYTPFLANVVRSHTNWVHFFTNLFFSGTVRDSLDCLDLQDQKENVYIRSPILQRWDSGSSSYTWKERPWVDEFIAPFLPYSFHLKASGSSPPRTWSSQLHANLHLSEDPKQQSFAKDVLQWTIRAIQRTSEDPKNNDDPGSGGEWFQQYLRVVHRDIYDDIDPTDPSQLLKRNQMPSETGGHTHAIGKIQMPSCESAFDEITRRYEEDIESHENPIEKRVEVLGKILIDIWVHQLVDYSTFLKIGNLVAQGDDDDVVVVAYLGTAHARAVTDFFCSNAEFAKKGFFGKAGWEEDESRKIQLPAKLWNPSELF